MARIARVVCRRLGALPVLVGFIGMMLSTAEATSDRELSFESPDGIQETCRRLEPITGGVYSATDREEEDRLCSIDWYDGATALCPKTASTSPGAMVFVLLDDLSAKEFEGQSCRAGAAAQAVFKTTMNAEGTSGTFSPASLLYYHFSRYFGTAVGVPPAVYRTVDRRAYGSRVVAKATGGSRMNVAGWRHMQAAVANPSTYKPISELFTDDRTQIYGVLLHHYLPRFGPEVNGTRASNQPSADDRDFQRTAPFLALASSEPVDVAVRRGLAEASKDPVMRAALTPVPDDGQMRAWMVEVSEIVLLDFIFEQQDRVGNIDYRWEWVPPTPDGPVVPVPDLYTKFPRARMSEIPRPEGPEYTGHVLRQHAVIGDNDAGGKREYVNRTRNAGMLERIRHLRPVTYAKLLALAEDFEADGVLHAYLRDQFPLSASQVAHIATNAIDARNLLRDACAAGRLQLDLEPANNLVIPECAAPVSASPPAAPGAAPAPGPGSAR